MWINGVRVEGSTLTRPQRVFIKRNCLDRIREAAKLNNLDPLKVEHMISAACDEDNYHRDQWHKTIDGVDFKFHLARFVVELRSITCVFS
jgi:hypothetical protein